MTEVQPLLELPGDPKELLTDTSSIEVVDHHVGGTNEMVFGHDVSVPATDAIGLIPVVPPLRGGRLLITAIISTLVSIATIGALGIIVLLLRLT